MERATATGDMHEQLGEDWTCGSENILVEKLAHGQTDTLITVLSKQSERIHTETYTEHHTQVSAVAN